MPGNNRANRSAVTANVAEGCWMDISAFYPSTVLLLSNTLMSRTPTLMVHLAMCKILNV